MSEPRSPWPRPRASQTELPPEAPPRAARVRVRIKGTTTEGDLYQGQHLVKKCGNCGRR